MWISRSRDRDYVPRTRNLILCWILIPFASSQYPLWALLIGGSMLNLLISVIPPGYYYHAGYRIKIKLICRITKTRHIRDCYLICCCSTSLQVPFPDQYFTICTTRGEIFTLGREHNSTNTLQTNEIKT